MENSTLCNNCIKGNHEDCCDKKNCPCKCNEKSSSDVVEKTLATLGGVAMAIGGIAVTLSSAGFGGILVGSALLGSGVSSAYQGIEKSIKHEKLNATSYVTDLVFGAATGIMSGGIGAIGETLATNVAKTVIVRSGAGAVAGLGSKAINEVKEIVTTDKKLSEFGQTLDENQKPLGFGATFTSWLTSAAVGALGGVAASADLNKIATSELGKSVTRVSLSAVTAATCDTVAQGVNIATGTQKEFNTERLLSSTVTAASTSIAFESVKQINYANNGGKEQYLQKKSNEKMIDEDSLLSDDKKQIVKKESNRLSEIKNLKRDIQKSIELKKTTYHKDHNNAHVLLGKRSSQIAFDVPDDSRAQTRGPHRVAYDIDGFYEDKTPILKYSGYIDDHNYKKLPLFGERTVEHQINKENFDTRGYLHINSTSNVLNIIDEKEEEENKKLQ